VSDWAEALDAFERRIAEQRAALDLGEAGELEPFVPPRRLGTLPPELEERARQLLAEATDVEAELAGALAHLGEDLAVVRKLTAATGRPAGARFIDTAL
jgi:hypothetical protein